MNFDQAEIRAEIIKALAHPVRLIIVQKLKDGDLPFSQINGEFEYDKSTVSKHLLVLKNAGIVSSKKIGGDVVYHIEMCCVNKFIDCVDSVLKQNIEKQQSCLC
ncbi:MAG: metalloregulator ArsR/SmtB family transcription factor [Candidatus Zophobacter franzmannii]|nr:metalloregulator ArsR/SmtB family transcription factor [Candidatus Zophobacter franzmannii]